MKIASLVTCLTLGAVHTACVTSPPRSYPSFRVQYVWSDNVALRRFDISFTNTASFDVFIPEGAWPFDDDRAFVSSRNYRVTGAGETIVPPDREGHCYRDCDVRVNAGQTITGNISYQSLGVPERLYEVPKTLVFVDGPWAYSYGP